MALKKCRECGKEVSSGADKCPHCGVSNPSGGLNFKIGGCGGLIAGVVLIYIIANAIGSGDHASSPSVSTPASTPMSRMTPNQATLLGRFQDACQSYDAQPNEIRKSAVFRGTAAFYSQVGRVEQWVGTIKRISTNQGGSNATIVIAMGTSKVYDDDVPIGSGVYNAAANLREGQSVTFSGRGLSDFNLTERGKVCNPDFKIHLTSLKPAQ